MEKRLSEIAGEAVRFYSHINNILRNTEETVLITNSSFFLLDSTNTNILNKNSWFSLTKMETTDDTVRFIFGKDSVYFKIEKFQVFFDVLTDILPRILRPIELISLGYFTVPEERPPPTPNSTFLRIKNKNKELSQQSIDEFLKILKYTKEYVDLDAFENQEEAIPAFFDALPLIPTIQSISVTSSENIDAYKVLSNEIGEIPFLEHIEIRGHVTKHFGSFLRHLSKNKEVPLYGLTFEESELTETKVKTLVKYMSDKYICSVGFHRAFKGDLSSLYNVFLPQMQKKLTLISLDTTEGIDVDKLFSFTFPALEMVSLKKCSLDISSVFEYLVDKYIPHLKGIDLSGNTCTKPIKEDLKMPPELQTVVVKDVKWADKSLFRFLSFIRNCFPKELRIDLSAADASSSDWRHTLNTLKDLQIPQLKSLIWRYNPHGTRFISFLTKNPQIEYLDVSYCYDDAHGNEIRSLGEFVCNSNISSFVLRGNDELYAGETLSILLEHLLKSKTLEYLDVSHSNGRDKSISALKDLIQSDVPLRFIAFDGIDALNPNVLFDLLYAGADNNKSVAVSFPINDLENLLESGLINQQQMKWAVDLYKQPLPTYNDQPTPFEMPFEVYKENFVPEFPVYLKPLAPSPDGIRTEDMVNTDVFSEERTEMTISVSGDQFNLVPIPKEDKNTNKESTENEKSCETYDLHTNDVIKNKDNKETKEESEHQEKSRSSKNASEAHKSLHSKHKARKSRKSSKSQSNSSKVSSRSDISSPSKGGDSQRKKSKKKHRRQKDKEKVIIDSEDCNWKLPIAFEYMGSINKVLETANKVYNLDDLVDSLPK